jgi:hypothetical protein
MTSAIYLPPGSRHAFPPDVIAAAKKFDKAICVAIADTKVMACRRRYL